MATVAEQLRQAREEQKLTVYQVAEATKIKTDHVRALEAGNYEGFAAAVYVRGFVRTCAAYLRLDVGQIMADLERELGESEQFRDSLSPRRQRGFMDTLSLLVAKVNWRIAVPGVLAGLVLWLLYVSIKAVQRAQTADPLANLGPGLYQPRQTNSGEILPLTLPAPPSTEPRRSAQGQR